MASDALALQRLHIYERVSLLSGGRSACLSNWLTKLFVISCFPAFLIRPTSF
jgi:hypothetical protein